MLDALGVLVARPMSAIKSVQYGTVTVLANTTSGTATITSVVIGKSVLIHLGSTTTVSSTAFGLRMTLTNSTTVTAVMGTTLAGDALANFVMVEFW